MDSLLEYDLHNLGYNIHEKCNATVVIDSVDYEDNCLRRIREMKGAGNIALIGFSMGCERIYRIAEQCGRERIPIKLIVFYDPTFTNSKVIYCPGHVQTLAAFFSKDGMDVMAWARGKRENISMGRGKIIIRDKEGKHLDLLTGRMLERIW